MSHAPRDVELREVYSQITTWTLTHIKCNEANVADRRAIAHPVATGTICEFDECGVFDD